MVNKCVFWCLLLFLLAGCGGSDSTTEIKAPTYDIPLPASMGFVLLKHSTHSAHACESCHQCGVGDGKISFISKDWAHSTCKTCHVETQRGPVNCKGCHATPVVSAKTVASTVTAVQTGSAEYTVYGSEMNSVSGLQIDIYYDSAMYLAPTVIQGELISGAMLASNTTQPGFIKVAAIKPTPFLGSGRIVLITFASATDASGSLSMTVTAIDGLGATVPVSVVSTSGPSSVSVPPLYPTQPPQSSSTIVPGVSTPATSSLPVCK